MYVSRSLRALLVAVLLVAVSGADAPPPGPTSGPGSATPSASASSHGGGVLRYALVTPASIDPAFLTDDPGTVVADALFDPLTTVRPDGTVVGAAAEDWEVSGDARTFTFTLREARFHDGQPVRAQDFVRGLNRVVGGTDDQRPSQPELLADVEGFEASYRTGVPLEGIEALDPRTLRIRLERPRADLPALLSHPALVPVPAVADRDAEGFGHRPIGNGPFRMDGSWDGGAEIVLVRNDSHPRPPAVDGVTFVLYAGEDADRLAYRDLLDGEVDVAADAAVPEGTAPRTVGSDVAGVYAFGFVTDHPPFDDAAVRRAFSLLIDREAVAPPPDEATPADAFVPPGLPSYQEGACAHCRWDRARALLLLAGRTVGPIRLLVTEDPVAVAAASRVARDVHDATGIEVEVVDAGVTAYLDRLDRGDVEVFGLRWDARSLSPDGLLYRSFASRNIGATNLTRYSSAQVDGMLAEARRTRDAARRRELYRSVERHILDEAVVAPAWFPRTAYGTAEAVHDLPLDAWGRPDLSRVSLER